MLQVNPWLEIPNIQKGLFQLVGHPQSNYSHLLYAKALLARRESHSIYYFDNKGSFDHDKLKLDFSDNKGLLEDFFIFQPKNLQDFISSIDDLDIFYFDTEKTNIVFINNIFEFLLKNPTNSKHLSLMVHSLGLLKELNIPVFITNEMRKQDAIELPFLSFFIPPFFDKVYIIEQKGKEIKFLVYNY